MYGLDEKPALNAMRTQSLHEFVERLNTGHAEENFLAAFVDFIAEYGFTSAASVIAPNPGSFTSDNLAISTRPRIWVEEYLNCELLTCDLILDAAAKFDHPFAWFGETDINCVPTQTVQIIPNGPDHNICDGFVVPIFGLSGKTGLVSIAGARIHLDSIARSRLTLAAMYLHQRLSSLRHAKSDANRNVALTAREIEMLKWIASGKSDWQIGRILNISQKTVNYHVENAKRKYGVATRIQAVVTALREGVLD